MIEKPSTSKSKEKNKKPKKESTWEFIRSMIFLVGIVIIVKWFVCDIFFIPSGSMEQTLHGHPDSGDRIFCTKLNYLWSTPKRWEVFVFKFPYQQSAEGENSAYKGEHFIKRCVGLPGESLALVGGDVFIKDNTGNHAIRQVKSNDTQDSIWLPVYNEDFSELSLDDLSYFWNLEASSKEQVAINSNMLRVNAISSPATLTFKPHTRFNSLAGIPDRYVRRQVVEFTCPVIGCNGKTRKTITTPKITSRCPRCGEYLQESDVTSYDYRTGYPANYSDAFSKVAKIADPQFRGEWWHFVPDLSIESKVTFHTATSSFTTIITVDGKKYATSFTPETGTKIYKNDKLLKEIPYTIPTGKESTIQFYHLDGQLRGYVNGKELFDIQVDPKKLNSEIADPESSNIILRISGSVDINDIAIKRDIYYYNYQDSRGFFNLPDDGYMALGDNCPSSNDSRFWGPVPASNLVGTAQFVWWPLHAIKMLH